MLRGFQNEVIYEALIVCEGQGKHREFGNFAKTQGILFGQVVNFLILKVKDIATFAA